MDKKKIDSYLQANSKYFTSDVIEMIKSSLKNADEDQLILLQSADLKDPILFLMASIFLGLLGIDRFLIGDSGIGILKACTFGGFGILWIIDIFLVMKKCKQKNFEEISAFL